MLRIEFYNEIARILTHKESTDLIIEPTDEEKEAIHHLLNILGRSYYGPPCAETVSTYYQDILAKLLKLNQAEFPEGEYHDNCPCVRSEKHDDFHRCKHGLYDA